MGLQFPSAAIFEGLRRKLCSKGGTAIKSQVALAIARFSAPRRMGYVIVLPRHASETRAAVRLLEAWSRRVEGQSTAGNKGSPAKSDDDGSSASAELRDSRPTQLPRAGLPYSATDLAIQPLMRASVLRPCRVV